jgi:hypothetical protein
VSTYWYFECLDHLPALRSIDELTQHTDDGAYRAGVELAQQRPLDAADYSTGTGHFEGNARSFLTQHPTCALGLVNEYGERRSLPTPSAEPMATCLHGHDAATMAGCCQRCGVQRFDPRGQQAAEPEDEVGVEPCPECGGLGYDVDWADPPSQGPCGSCGGSGNLDPSTIRDVTPPATPEAGS